MPDPVIVPSAPPTINQGDDISKAVQEMFDKKLPAIKTRPSSASSPEPQPQPEQKPQPPQTPPEPVPQPQPPQPEPRPAVAKEPSHEVPLPSFLEEAIKATEVKPPTPEVTDEDWPEEPQKIKENYRKWRDSWFERGKTIKTLKAQLEDAAKHGVADPAAVARIQQLEQDNVQMAQTLSRVGVETNPRFQQEVLGPMHYHYQKARSIVHEVGGDIEALDRALSLRGREHYNAMDELLSGIPESAKQRINSELGEYQRLNEIRVAHLQRAPETLARYQQEQMAWQYQNLNNQKNQMNALVDEVIREMTPKVEVFRDDTDSEPWNERAKVLKNAFRQTILENTDYKRLANAVALGYATDAYRSLFQVMLKRAVKAEKELRAIRGAEPTIEGGDEGLSYSSPDEQLKRPIKDVFLEILHGQAQR
jgi:hypothetical protein